MVERSVLAHHLNKVHLIGLRIENFTFRVFGIEFWGPCAFKVSGISEHNLSVGWNIGLCEEIRYIALCYHANEIVDLFKRLHRLLPEVQVLRLINDDITNARIQLNLFGEIKTIDWWEFDGRVCFVVITKTLLKLVSLKDIRFTVSPVKLENCLRWREKKIKLINWTWDNISISFTFNPFSVWLPLPK